MKFLSVLLSVCFVLPAISSGGARSTVQSSSRQAISQQTWCGIERAHNPVEMIASRLAMQALSRQRRASLLPLAWIAYLVWLLVAGDEPASGTLLLATFFRPGGSPGDHSKEPVSDPQNLLVQARAALNAMDLETFETVMNKLRHSASILLTSASSLKKLREDQDITRRVLRAVENLPSNAKSVIDAAYLPNGRLTPGQQLKIAERVSARLRMLLDALQWRVRTAPSTLTPRDENELKEIDYALTSFWELRIHNHHLRLRDSPELLELARDVRLELEAARRW